MENSENAVYRSRNFVEIVLGGEDRKSDLLAHPYVANQLPCLSLLGRIGENGSVVYLGAATTFRAETSGQLYFGVNNFFSDNSGSWAASISVGSATLGGAVKVDVQANRATTDTGVRVNAGDTVMISASGSVIVTTDGHIPPMSPAGFPPNCAAATVYGQFRVPFPAPQFACWSLIGQIGSSGAFFEIGTNTIFQAPTAGELHLGINDNNLGDNSGSWTASVTVSSVATVGTSHGRSIPLPGDR